LVVVVPDQLRNQQEVIQVFLVPSHSLQHIQQQAVAAADQDNNPLVVMVDPVVVEVDRVEPQEVLHNQHLTQVLLNMEMMVVLLALMLVVEVEQAVLVNRLLTDQTYRDGVELEYKHQQHSEILMQDMVDLSLEEIHQEMTGDLPVVAVVEVLQILLVLMVVLGLHLEEYQVDHTMVEDLAH
tara:strand:+ start:819 stop:1364 length:546 start_codon:yes stop_codon:yes gene_type:complete